MDLRRFAMTIVVAICLAAPVAEWFDRWDNTAKDGNDTEANLVIAALCVGCAFSMAIKMTPPSLQARRLGDAVFRGGPNSAPREPRVRIRPVPTVSPPVLLR